MPSPNRPETHRLPLHIHLSVMFTCLLLLTGAVLGAYNYRQTTQIILTSSANLFDRIARDVQLDLHHTYQPIRQLLNLLTVDTTNQSDHLEQRLALLPPFTQALKDHPELTSLYLGYLNGDFFMVRPLRTPALKHYFDAPQNASYQVWSIERGTQTGRLRSESLFFDEALTLIERRLNPDETYDPRTRDWFISALADQSQITTEPYVFFSSRDVGTTLARRSGATAVIATDMTLAQLSATLAKHKVTPSTEIALFNSAGDAVAYPDYSRLIINPESALLAKVQSLSPALHALLAQGQNEENRLDVDQRQWVVSRSHLQEGAPEGLQLALLVPEDELLVDAYRLRWQGGFITLTILLLCLPLGWLASRALVKPLRGLTREADAIRSFDFNTPVSQRSSVLEVDQLTVAIAHMKETLASFLAISANLSAQSQLEPLLEQVLFETTNIAQARAGLLYLTDSASNCLEPHTLTLDGVTQDPARFGLSSLSIQNTDTPHWLRLLTPKRNSVVETLGFEQAGELRTLLNALQSPRVHLVAVRLHGTGDKLIGVLTLLLPDSGSEADLDTLQPDRIAFIQAICDKAAVCIERQHLQKKERHDTIRP